MRTVTYNVHAQVGDMVSFHTGVKTIHTGRVVCIKIADLGETEEERELNGRVVYRVDVYGEGRYRTVYSGDLAAVFDPATNQFIKINHPMLEAK